MSFSMPWERKFSTRRSRIGLPPTTVRHLGASSVKGRKREPVPAASKRAVLTRLDFGVMMFANGNFGTNFSLGSNGFLGSRRYFYIAKTKHLSHGKAVLLDSSRYKMCCRD